jgi:hypothetical protein
MLRVDEALANAPADVCFRVAMDVERWPRILPHYRWVRFRERAGIGAGVVEMAAWRPFPVGGWPTWWVSRMEADPAARTVRYRHVAGVTKGMDVLWEVGPTDDGRTKLTIVHEWSGPRWPLIGGLAANLVIGPGFVSHIAQRTLAGIVRAAEAESGARS